MVNGSPSKSNKSNAWAFSTPVKSVIPGTDVTIFKEVFGALSQDEDDPLSRISMANSAISLDPFRGCPARCAYCTVAGAKRDIDLQSQPDALGRVIKLPTKPQRLFTGTALVDALVRHPAFLRNRSVLSFSTASSEPFISSVEDSTWEMIKRLLWHDCKNPLWFVTKLGISQQLLPRWERRFHELSADNVKVLISISYAAAPAWVEPYREDRFRYAPALRDAGVRISHHLRPILPGINDDPSHLITALDKSLHEVEAVCLGGLRRDEGVTLAWQHINKLDPTLLPTTGRTKTLSRDTIEFVRRYVADRNDHIPVFLRSSEAIAHLLGTREYNLYRYRVEPESKNNQSVTQNDSLLTIPSHIRQVVERRFGQNLTSLFQRIAGEIGLERLTFIICGSQVAASRPLSYVEERALLHAIGHADLLP